MLEVKQLESIRGKLCSWMIVIPIMQLFIREQNALIQKADLLRCSQFSWKTIDRQALIEELDVWRKLELVKLSRKWREERHKVFSLPSEATLDVYTDSSQYSMGGKIFKKGQTSSPIHTRHFQWTNDDKDQPIHLKEVSSLPYLE